MKLNWHNFPPTSKIEPFCSSESLAMHQIEKKKMLTPQGFQSSQQQRRNPRNKRPELTPEQTEELREVFTLFDVSQTNSIDAREFKAALRALGFDVKKEHIIAIMSEAGKDITETISFEEFCNMMVGRLPDKTAKEEIHKLFRLFDEDGVGKISFRNLKKIAAEVGENLTDDELQEMIDEADRDGDGAVSFDEFYRVMRYRNNPLEDSDDEDEVE